MQISEILATNRIFRNIVELIIRHHQRTRLYIILNLNRPMKHRLRLLFPTRITRKSCQDDHIDQRYCQNESCFNNRSDFRGIIDYVFYAKQLMRVLGVLGPLDPDWMQTNKIVGCPHPHIPSDHFSLLVEFELNPLNTDQSSSISTSPSMLIRRS
jgi:hypothetical protein